MTESSEGVSWERGWSAPPRELSTQPKPEHESDSVDVKPSNSEPASSVDPRLFGRKATESEVRRSWD